MAGNRFNILNYEQVLRLVALMDTQVTIDMTQRSANPCIRLQVVQLVQAIKRKLSERNVQVRNCRLNGGAATYVIGGDTQSYNDVDIIFDIDLPHDHEEETLDHVRQAVFSTLDDYANIDCNSNRNANGKSNGNNDRVEEYEVNCETEDESISETTVASNSTSTSTSISTSALLSPYNVPLATAAIMRERDSCIRKLIKVYNEQDRWSLIALSNSSGKNVELKFVNKIRRPFEFTVDAFQVILDSLLSFYENNMPRRPLSLDYYPTVAAENVYGNYTEAHFHLQNKIIFTRDPEEIRGGGLLRYARLIVEGYRPSEKLDVRLLQEFMCSRFFIDFPTLGEQEAKLRSYLDNHFPGVKNHHEKYRYLLTLCQIVAESTICLMNYDRQQTISLILCLAQSILAEYHQSNISLCAFMQPVGNMVYYKPFEPPLLYATPLNLVQVRQYRGSGSGSGSGNRNKTQAPRMRSRRPLSAEQTHAPFACQSAASKIMAISVL